RALAMVLSAAREALADAGLEPRGARIALALGTALGSIESAAWSGPPDLRHLVPHGLTREVAAQLGLEGPTSTFSVTCASALYALEQAVALVEAGRADAALVGGID